MIKKVKILAYTVLSMIIAGTVLQYTLFYNYGLNAIRLNNISHSLIFITLSYILYILLENNEKLRKVRNLTRVLIYACMPVIIGNIFSFSNYWWFYSGILVIFLWIMFKYNKL